MNRIKLVSFMVVVAGTAMLSDSYFSRAGADDKAARADKLYIQAMAIVEESLDQESVSKALKLLEEAARLDPSSEEIWIGKESDQTAMQSVQIHQIMMRKCSQEQLTRMLQRTVFNHEIEIAGSESRKQARIHAAQI